MPAVENTVSHPGVRLPLSADPIALFRSSAWWIFGFLVAVDLATAVIAPLGTVGVLLWYLSYLYLVAFALVGLRDVVRYLVTARQALPVVVILVYGAIVAVNLTDPRSLSAEAGHEIDCALRLLASSPDHGFRGTCLFGYPARQFFLPALPSVLFGRSQLTLNLGGDLYFLFGVLLFAGGVIRYRGGDEVAGPLAALLLTVFLHVYFWNHFILIYEQSIFPLSFALIGGGLLLYYLAGERAVLPVGGLLLLYLIDAYTPSLAVYGLAILTIVYLTLRGPLSRPIAAALIAGSLLALHLSYGFRGDLNVGAGGNPALRHDILAALEHVVFLNHGVPVTSPVLVWPFLSAVALCLGWQLGLPGFVVGCWVVAVYLIAVVSHGYSLNALDFRLHRAMIIFPVLITLGAIASRRVTGMRAADALSVLVALMLLTGITFHLQYRNAQQPNQSLTFASWLQTHGPVQGSISQPVPMWWSPGTDQFLPAVRDVLGYLDPNFQQGVISQTLLGPSCPAARLYGVLVLPARGACFDKLRAQVASTSTRFDGYYTQPNGQSLAVFDRPANGSH